MLNNTKTQSRPKLLFLVPAVSQTHKSLENSQDFFVKTKTKTFTSRPRPRLWVSRPRLYFFILEAPRDQDFGLEDYITGLHRYYEHSKCSPLTNTRCQMMTPLLYCTCMMICLSSPISKQSWILCILYRQCQFNKVIRMPTSTTYFRQIIVSVLDLQWVFAESYVNLQYFVTNVSLVTLFT